MSSHHQQGNERLPQTRIWARPCTKGDVNDSDKSHRVHASWSTTPRERWHWCSEVASPQPCLHFPRRPPLSPCTRIASRLMGHTLTGHTCALSWRRDCTRCPYSPTHPNHLPKWIISSSTVMTPVPVSSISLNRSSNSATSCVFRTPPASRAALCASVPPAFPRSPLDMPLEMAPLCADGDAERGGPQKRQERARGWRERKDGKEWVGSPG